MRLIFLPLFLALVLTASARERYWPPEPTFQESALRVKMDRIVIPKLDFKDESFEDAVEFLRRHASAADSVGLGVPIEIAAPSSPDASGGGAADFRETRLTVTLYHIPLTEALRYVTSLTGSKYVVKEDRVLIVPASEVTEVLKTQRIPLPVQIFGRASWAEEFGVNPKSVRELREDPKGFLENHGVFFIEGASCAFEDEPPVLVMTIPDEQLESVNDVLADLIPKPAPSTDSPKVLLEEDSSKSRTMATAAFFKLPEVDLHDLPLAKAIERLGEVISRTLPGGGFLLPLAVAEDEKVTAGQGILPLAERRIFYRARNVSVLEAARAIAAQARGVVVAEYDHLVFRLSDEPSPTRPVAKQYVLPSDVFRLLPPTSDPSPEALMEGILRLRLNPDRPQDAFPPGSTDIDFRVSIKTVADRHARMEAKVHEIWKAYYASEAWAHREKIHRRLRALFPDASRQDAGE